MIRVDLTGQTFGQWTVDAKDPCPSARNRATYWLVTCTCGTESSIRTSDLVSGRSIRCKKCYHKSLAKPKPVNLQKAPIRPGQRFGRWTIVKRDPKKNKPGDPHTFWICVCECGGTYSVRSQDLKRGKSRQCKSCAARTRQRRVYTKTPISRQMEPVTASATPV